MFTHIKLFNTTYLIPITKVGEPAPTAKTPIESINIDPNTLPTEEQVISYYNDNKMRFDGMQHVLYLAENNSNMASAQPYHFRKLTIGESHGSK